MQLSNLGVNEYGRIQGPSGHYIPTARNYNANNNPQSLQGLGWGVKLDTPYGGASYNSSGGAEPPQQQQEQGFPTWGYVALAIGGAALIWFMVGAKKRR